MAVLPKIGWTAMYLPFLYYALASSAVCNSEVYGSPNQQDCAQALRNIPFATSGPSSPSSLQSHIFAEPQYMDPPFGGIDNMFPSHAIVQLPKIWKRNSCHIAIMSEGRPGQPGVVAPQFTTTWRNVVDQAAQFSACLAGGQAKGGYVPLNLPGGYLGAAMYMYTSDSNWNTLTMNTYMTSGIPVLPHTQANQLGLPSNDSSSSQLRLLNTTSFSTGTSLDVLAISIKPLAPGELVLQDET